MPMRSLSPRANLTPASVLRERYGRQSLLNAGRFHRHANGAPRARGAPSRCAPNSRAIKRATHPPGATCVTPRTPVHGQVAAWVPVRCTRYQVRPHTLAREWRCRRQQSVPTANCHRGGTPKRREFLPTANTPYGAVNAAACRETRSRLRLADNDGLLFARLLDK